MRGEDGTGPVGPREAAARHAARAEALLRSASLSTGAGRAAALREAARAFFAAGDEARGRSATREAYDAWPADDASFIDALRDATSDVDRLEAVLAARARAVPTEAVACNRARADALLAFGRAEAAVAGYQGCLEATPEDPGALAGLAEAWSELGRGAEALAAARRLVEASADGQDARQAALELASRIAERFDDRGADVADLLEVAAAVHLRTEGGTPSANARVQRAVDALLREGENARAGALMALAAGTSEGPVRAGWLIRLSEAAAARGDEAAARAAREEALQSDPGDAALRARHLADLERSGDAAALVEALSAALEAPGADVASLTLRLARARSAAGDAVGAQRAYAAVCAMGPGAPGWEEASRAVGAHLDAAGDLDGRARLELARASATTDPAALSAALLTAAALLERAGDLDQARTTAERARDADPSSPAPWKVIARLALASGDRAGAARALLSAASVSSGASAAAAAIDAARLLESIGLDEEATAALERAVAAVPGSPAARRALAERAREAGDLAAAARHLALVEPGALAPDERRGHDRALARALSEASDPSAEAAWRALFDADETDGEAFDRISELLRARGAAEQWLALAARHEGALSGGSDTARRCDLRCERAALLTDLGDLDAAEGAWQAALALDPGHRRALRGMRALLEHRGDHAGAADRIAAEAAVVKDPEEAAELHVDEARVSLERLQDHDRAARAFAAAVDRLRAVPPRRARRLLVQADRMGVSVEGLAPPPGPPGAAEEVDRDDGGTPEDERLRSLAAAATGAERAAYLHRLGLRLERRGDRAAAREVALAALEADPASAERFRRAATLASDDRGKLLAAHRLRVRGARTPSARAAALLELGALLASSPESLPEAAEVLERAYALHPTSGAAAAALARALLALGDPERAVTILSRFEAGAPDLPAAEAVRLLVEAAQAAGDPALAVEMARRAADRSPRDPAVLAGFAAALIAAGREREAIGIEARALALEPPGPERVRRQAALAARADAAGDPTRALWLYQGVRAARPDDAGVLTALARIHAAGNDAFQLASVARDLHRLGATDTLGPHAASAGRALLRAGDPEGALAFLAAARRNAPADLAILRDVAAAAERAGRFAEAVEAGAAAAEAEAARYPASAAARLLHVAELAAHPLGDAPLAAALRERAAALGPFEAAPADPTPPAAHREAAPRSVDGALARAREALFDPVVCGEVAGLARLLASGTHGAHVHRLAVLARSAGAIAAFATASALRLPGSARPVRVFPDVRASIAHPDAQTAAARLLALLAPFLEPLFPADLARHGVSAASRLGPRCAPELLELLEQSQRALGTRPCAAFLAEVDGLEVALENTAPPSIVLPAGVAGLPAPQRSFLVARALALVDLGWALAGKFAPRDVAIVCELGCRFGGREPASPLLPEARARPFLEALARGVPAVVRARVSALAAAAAADLPTLDPRQLTAALRRTAARIALLHTGDPHAALTALAAAEPRLAGLQRSQAAEDADLRDLAAFALSDAYLDRRAEAEVAT